MKRIIKHGNITVAVCEYCQCVFSYEYMDVEGNQHDGFWITCPECGHETDMSKAKYNEHCNK